MNEAFLGMRVLKETKDDMLKWKKKHREKRLFADIYIADQVIRLGMKYFDKGERE